MKQKIKKMLKMVFRIESEIVNRSNMRNRINEYEYKKRILVNQKIDLRITRKVKNKEKISVVFVCHRPAVWGSLESVYEVLHNDERFEVKIVAIPNKKELPRKGFYHENYESEGAEEFWKKYDCINGYNYKSGKWLDIKLLNPDYVFFQQPYNITRSKLYKSSVVSKYAKICYVAYAIDFIGGGVLEETTPIDFMKDVSEYYTQNTIDHILVRNILDKNHLFDTRTVLTGFPRYDQLEKYKDCDSICWKNDPDSKAFRVLWTPRWCTNEGNCSFFDYKDKIVDFFSVHKEFEFVFRPHPQAFVNWNRTGEFTMEQAEAYKEKYFESDNMSIDFRYEYFDTIFSSDCLISDISSFVADYFITGKPVIYCHKINMFNEISQKMSEGFYWVSCWEELEKIISMLQKGIDPLKEKRKEILDGLQMTACYENAAAMKIRDSILQNAMK